MRTTRHSPLRVAILTNIIPRYRTPVLATVARDPRFDLRFFVSISPDASDPLAREILDLHQSRTLNIRMGTQTRSAGVVQKERMPIPFALPFDLLRYRPDIIISGDLGVRSFMALFVARLLRVPLVIWTEETIEHDALVGGRQRRLRSFLLPRADGFLAWGKAAVSYLVSKGVPENRITYSAQAVDNSEWAERAASADPVALRKAIGTKGRVCLAVGRLLPRKGFKEMLAAFGALPESIKRNHSLVMVGEGPEMDSLQEQARSLGIRNFFMLGPKSPDELAHYYRAADFMVLPSLTDVWGLVVNEAMACGIPVVSSVHAGVTEELIIDTGIGEPFDPNNQQEFTAILQRWLETPPPIEDGAPQRAVAGLNFDVSIKAISGLLERIRS